MTAVFPHPSNLGGRRPKNPPRCHGLEYLRTIIIQLVIYISLRTLLLRVLEVLKDKILLSLINTVHILQEVEQSARTPCLRSA